MKDANDTTISETITLPVKINKKHIAELSTINDLSARIAAMNWSSSQGEEIKIDIFTLHTDLIRQRRVPGKPVTAEFSYAMFLLASKNTRINEEALRYKRDLSVLETEEIARKRAEGFQKPKRKKGSKKLSQIRKQFFAMITILREKHGYSWAEVCAYLHNYHAFIVSRAYIQQAYRQLKEEVAGNEKSS